MNLISKTSLIPKKAKNVAQAVGKAAATAGAVVKTANMQQKAKKYRMSEGGMIKRKTY